MIRAQDHRVPIRVSSPVFVGRAAEREALAAALARAASGQPGVVLITGEPGVGKSRLLAECATLASSLGFAAAGGLCLDVAAGALPFGPFVDIIRALWRSDLLRDCSPSTLAELSRLAPELAAAPDQRSGTIDGAQGRLFASVRDAVDGASATTPILISIEDLHWADASSLDLLTYVARSMDHARCLLVATARLEALPRRHPLVGIAAELARLPRMERIELARFDEREIAQQMAGILGRAPDTEAVRGVFERSDGNAFFAEELIASGVSRHGPLPSSLRDVLAARLGALGDATQRVLRVAAVAGPVVQHDLLARVVGGPQAQLLDALREAVDQRVLVSDAGPTPAYAFRHSLVREAAYDELLATERVSLHLAYAAELERLDPSASGGGRDRSGEIAYHAMAAHDLPRALKASIQAAAVAEAASAYAEAELHIERIVEIWPLVPEPPDAAGIDHAEWLARLARVAASAGHASRAVTAARAASAALGPAESDRRLAILLDAFDYAWEATDVAGAERSVVDALAIIDDEHAPRGSQAQRTQALIAQALLHFHRGRYAIAAETVSRAIATARASGARRELARALTVEGQVLTQLGETNRASESFDEAAGYLDVVADPVVSERSHRFRGWAKFMHGDFQRSLELSLLGLEVARREGADARLGVHALDGALESLVELGRWDEAAATAEQILARANVSFELGYTHSTLARMYTLQGRLADAEREIQQAALVPAIGPHRVWLLEDAILLAYAAGRHGEARQLMESAIAVSMDPERDATLWWALGKAVAGEADRAQAARTRRRTHEADEAIAAGRRFAELSRRSTKRAIDADGAGPLARAELASVDAELRRLEDRPAPGAWAAAVTARAQLQQPWELAYAKFRLAEAILERGGPTADAAAPLRNALGIATNLGASPLEAQIRSLAGRARIGIDESPNGQVAPGGPTILTGREQEVLRLVAAGHTNREIGERLYISEKTASVHVTRAMGKLGALSRYEAAATATRLGLLEPAAGSEA